MLFYSHVNEDNAVELHTMASMPVDELYVVAGSGERVPALLDHPTLKRVYIIDINPNALWLQGTLCDPLLHPIRESAEFQALIKEHFPKFSLITARMPGG